MVKESLAHTESEAGWACKLVGISWRKKNLLTLPVTISQFRSLVFIGCLEVEAVFVGYKVIRM
jgi:hypothetical protein